MRISDWSSDVCASDRAEEGRDVGAEIVDGIAAFHDDQRRQSRVGDFPADHRIILRLQPEEGNRVAAERVGAEGQDQQFRREDADAVYRLVERRDELSEGGAARERDVVVGAFARPFISEEPTSALQSLMRISYAVFCLKKKQLNSTT